MDPNNHQPQTLAAKTELDRAPDGNPCGDLELTQFPSCGQSLFARMFLPSGQSWGTVVLLHGFPGVELNFDLAHAFRRAGLRVFLPHFRGSWGMPGTYSFTHVVEDTAATLAFARGPEFARRYGQAGPVSLVGHSMGGFAALMGGVDPTVHRVVSMGGFNLGAFAQAQGSRPDPEGGIAAGWEAFVSPLQGTSARALARETLHAAAEWDLAGLAPRYRDRPVLLLCAERDTIAPPALHHDPLVQAFRMSKAQVTEGRFDAEHGFLDVRPQVACIILGWLKK